MISASPLSEVILVYLLIKPLIEPSPLVLSQIRTALDSSENKGGKESTIMVWEIILAKLSANQFLEKEQKLDFALWNG